MMPAVDVLATTPAEPGAMRVTRIQDAEGLASLRPSWDELLQASAANGPFLTWEWLSASWRHLAGSAKLHVLAVWSGDRLAGIAPFVVTQSAFGWFPRVEFLGTGYAGSDYLDLIVRPGFEVPVLREIAKTLTDQQYTARLDHVPDVSLSTQLAERLRFNGWAASTLPGGTCPVIDLAGHTWDSYLATLGSAHRANVRRRVRGLDKEFESRFEPVTGHAARREALAALSAFHERRFQAEGGSTAFLNPSVRAFQDDATQLMLERGWLRMYVLRLNGAIGAVMYGFAYHDTFYFYQHGFDDRHQRHSIGLALMAMTIRAAIDEGMQTFDMLWGTEAYKSLWTRDARTLRRIDLFPAHFGGRIRRRAVETHRRFGPIARRVLTLGEARDV
jgi:CelD/BcsL family acetyltransferase involved in cellulose biosynthesis